MFEDRIDAGTRLSEILTGKVELENGIVLGIARGGVVLARVLADNLGLPLDVLVVKKIGAPGHEELAVGAVGPMDTSYFDEKICESLGISEDLKKELLEKKILERDEKELELRGNNEKMDLTGRKVLVVDDGVATGATVLAAGLAAKKMRALKVLLTTPVIALDTLEVVRKVYDDVYYLEAPEEFYAVGQFYKNFPQVSDEEVRKLI